MLVSKKMKQGQTGQILLIALVVVGLVMVNSLMIAGGSQTFYQSTTYSVQSAEAINLAEAGIDKALASLNASGGSYSGEPETVIGDGSYSVVITSPTANTKIIESTGYIPSKSNAKVKRTIKITAAKGIGAAFNYAVQVGEGGFKMNNNSVINGSIYSNGNIEMNNNARITGDAYVAGGVDPTADQQSDCTDPNCADFPFGTNINGSDILDVAQGFQLSKSDYLTKISLKLKKYGSPPDLQVRILGDKSGNPDKNNVLASGLLSQSIVTDKYNFVDVTFSSSPYLTANTPYWIVADTSSNTAYWSWSGDSILGYPQGNAKWSSNWQAKTPVWNQVNLDLGFKAYLGGTVTYIQGTNGAVISGNAHAHLLEDLSVTKGAYYQTIQNVTAGNLYPGSEDPSAKVMPISDGNISDWKDLAQNSGVYTGNISSCVNRLGPGKYVGNVNISNGCNVVIKDPVWVTGNLNLSNNVVIKLDPSYGAGSGVFIVDGTITLSNGIIIKGSGTSGSVLTLISLYNSQANGIPAIDINNSGNQGGLFAPYGIIDIANSNNLTELAAWKIILSNDVTINYDTGMASVWFSSGPQGAFSLVKGTYQLK